MKQKKQTLYAPDGRPYEAVGAAEVTRLRQAHGYTTKPPKASTATENPAPASNEPAPEPTPTPTSAPSAGKASGKSSKK